MVVGSGFSWGWRRSGALGRRWSRLSGGRGSEVHEGAQRTDGSRRSAGGRGEQMSGVGGSPRVTAEVGVEVGGSPRVAAEVGVEVAAEGRRRGFWERVTEGLERRSWGFGRGDRWGIRALRGLDVEVAFTVRSWGLPGFMGLAEVRGVREGARGSRASGGVPGVTGFVEVHHVSLQ